MLGQKRKHIILAQNCFRYSDGLYDIDYTAVPVPWTTNATVIAKAHVAAALEKFEAIGFDCALLAGTRYAAQAVSEVGCEAVSAVLEELSKQDAGVRRRLVGLRGVYPKHEDFMAKLAELDVAGLAKALKWLSFMAQTKVYLFWSKDQAG